MDNVGNMVNSGVEMDFNVNIFDTRNFTWDVNVNISTLKNRITMLDPDKLITTEYTADGKDIRAILTEASSLVRICLCLHGA